jgi:LytS/YehU family sensor histidine kinase
LAFGFAVSMTAYTARRFVPARWRAYTGVAAAFALASLPWAPGFDGVALLILLMPALVSVVAAIQGIRVRRAGAIAALVSLAIFCVLILLQPTLFLDTTFYIAVSLMALVLFVDQALALKRARDAEALASRRAAMLELELLRRRIAPHFLMNTLNALTEWVESDPKTGVKMIEALAGEFRLLSQIADRNLVPLSDEIALCRRHLEVMSYRVDRAFSLDTEGVDETLEVPPGVLHTQVENAFTHGRFADGAVFRLRQEAAEGGVRLVLVAPQPQGPARHESSGEGMSYIRGRLEAAFGQRASAETGAAPDGWRTVLTLPRPA